MRRRLLWPRPATSPGAAGEAAAGRRGRALFGPLALAVAAWLVGAATAVAVGLVALSFVGTGLWHGPNDPLALAGSQPSESASASPSTPAVTPMPSATATPAAGVERPLASAGGTVVARCTGSSVYLVLWSPAQGFHASDVVRGPAPVARLKFESRTQEIKLRISCVDSIPQASVTEEAH